MELLFSCVANVRLGNHPALDEMCSPGHSQSLCKAEGHVPGEGRGTEQAFTVASPCQRLFNCSCACARPSWAEVLFLLKELNAYFMGTVNSSGPCVLLVLCAYHCIALTTLTIV